MKTHQAGQLAFIKAFTAAASISALLTCAAVAQGQSAFGIVGPARAAFQLVSPAFTNSGQLPAEFTCDGLKSSPPLEWRNCPVGTKSFALTMHHIPGPGDKHVYWVVYNIPKDTHSLPKNATNIGVRGINTVNGMTEYTPPCSKGPGPKTYILTVYALSAEPRITSEPSAVTMDILLDAIKDRTIATAVMNVTYDRTGKTTDAGPAAGTGNAPGPQGLMDALPKLSIPMEVYPSLNLSPQQQHMLTALLPAAATAQQTSPPTEQSRRDLHEKALAILTPDQRKLVEDYHENHRPPAPR